MEDSITITTTIGQDLRVLSTMKSERAEAKSAYEDLDRKVRAYERQVYDRMADEGVKGYKDDEGYTYTASSREYGQVRDRAVFTAWALENEPELVQYKERSAELNALVRQRLDDDEPLPPGVDFYTRDTISIRTA